MILRRFQWYRRWRGGKWGMVSGLIYGRKWIKLSSQSVQFDEDWGEYFYGI
jgi:hypothetical protein